MFIENVGYTKNSVESNSYCGPSYVWRMRLGKPGVILPFAGHVFISKLENIALV